MPAATKKGHDGSRSGHAADFPRGGNCRRGRLDKMSTGFVLLTDDGALAHDILPLPTTSRSSM